jgi:large subunit ribosomal protein L17
MRHKISGKKLNRTSSHRTALLCNLVSSLILHEQIQTTVTKAKFLRPCVEKLITKAKEDTLSARRLLISRIKNKAAVAKLIDVVAKRYLNRPGGYTRIIKSGFRLGDAAPMAYIELLNWEQYIDEAQLKMAKNTSSAKKQYRKSIKQRLVNLYTASRIKTLIKKIIVLIDAKKKDEAQAFFPDVQSAIMKGVKKNILKMNTASRKISNLSQKIKAV